MRFLRDLAAALGVSITALFRSDDEPVEPPGCADVCDPSDVRRVGAVLAEAQTMTAVHALASALGWTLARTFVALDQLEASLDAAGQRLRWIHDSYVGICAADPDDDVLDVLAGSNFAIRGMNVNEAALLAKLANDGPQPRTAELPKFPLQRLTRAGYIDTTVLDSDAERTAAGRVGDGARLTERAIYDLMLDA